jgi:CheY-like chemotaxis protein
MAITQSRDMKHELAANQRVGGVLASHRVLVIDDNRDAADTLAMLLTELGQTVKCAYDGRSGLRLCAEFRPSIVFIDLVMPGLGGLEVAASIRNMPEGPAKIVGVTGFGVHDLRALALSDDFDVHLIKPVGAPTIEEILGRA